MNRVLFCVVMLAVFSVSSFARSAEPKGADENSKKQSRAAAKSMLNPAAASGEKPGAAAEFSEAETLAFAREHHPELADLLANLKQMNTKEFHKALRQLNQARQRLVRIERTSPAKYELALAGWKLDSRIKLLAARMTMSDDPMLEDELRKLVRERQEVRINELKSEKTQLTQRLGKVENLLQQLESDREKSLQSEIDRIKQGLESGSATGGKPRKDTVKQARKAAKNKAGLTSGDEK